MNDRLASKTLATLPGYTCSVTENVGLDEVQQIFDENDKLPGVIVVVDQKPCGLLGRSKCALFMHNYTKAGSPLPKIEELLQDRVIHPVQVFDADDQIDSVAAACLQRPGKAVYDPIVVSHPGPSYRLVEFRSLFESYTIFCEELQRKTEEVMKQSADQAVRSQNLFIANMSHEIRTPLTAILGFAENILDGNTTREEMQQAAETIVRNGAHLLSLLNDVLDFAKYEAGKLTIERIPFSLPNLLHDVVAVMHLKAETKNLDLRLTQTSALPDSVISDPTRIRQILINLVGNAIKFTVKGHVEIRISYQSENENSGKLILSVEDTGIGMKKDRMHTLFTPFSQADQSTTRKFGGTGLGLTICRRLTKMLKGEMTVKSVFGKGSVFTASLPVSLPAQTHFVDDLTEIKQKSGYVTFDYEKAQTPCRVFLAEDSPDSQVLITGFLEKCGMNVTLGTNGQIAYEKIMQSVRAGDPYDLILMDMQMPILDGFEATARLRSEGLTTPIIALTASVLEQDKQHCLDVGCNTLSSKPLERERLIEQIRELLPDGLDSEQQSITPLKIQEDVSSRTIPKLAISQETADDSPVQRSDFYKSVLDDEVEEQEEDTNKGFASTFATGIFQAPKMILVDRKVALARSANDPELLSSVTELILEHCPKYMDDLTSAVANRDAVVTKRLAHTIKGSAENVGGKRISDVARQLETSADEQLWPQVDAEYEELKGLMTPFLNSVRELQSSLVQR